jgi:hypothetical protein
LCVTGERGRLTERLRAMNGDQRRFAGLLVVLLVVGSVSVGRIFLTPKSSSSGAVGTRPPTPAAVRHALNTPARVKANVKVTPSLATTPTTAIQLSVDESFQVFDTRDPFQPPVSPTTSSNTGHTVSVVDVFTDSAHHPRAHVQVGSTVYNVGVRETFARSYKVVSLSGHCGMFLFGDSSFQLCEGQQTIN